MANLNKYGELDSPCCTECSNPVEKNWKICPECGHNLLQLRTGHKQTPINMFECPGCGERSSSKDSFFCDGCGRYVHIVCLQKCGSTAAKILLGCPRCRQQLGSRKKQKKGCFISTAISSSLGFPDDCHELNILRRFRDTYMRSASDRQQEVERYYRIAPTIVETISQRPDAPDICRGLWTSHLAPAIAAIEHGNDDRAHVIYRDMVQSLTHFYEPVNVEDV